VDPSSFSEIHKPHNIPERLRVIIAIEYVNFNPGDVHTGGYLRQILYPPSVIVAEVMPKEEVAVLIVIRGNDLKWPALAVVASRNLDRSDLTALRRGDSSHIEFPELHLCFHAKQVLGALNERVVQGQANVSDLEFLKDIFFVPRILDLHIVLKVERVVVIEIRGNGQFLAYLAYDAHVDLLIKFKTAVALLPNGD
jgi:hypothetical protein